MTPDTIHPTGPPSLTATLTELSRAHANVTRNTGTGKYLAQIGTPGSLVRLIGEGADILRLAEEVAAQVEAIKAERPEDR
jgi:hypothetical protein